MKHSPAPWYSEEFTRNGKVQKHFTIITEYNHIAEVYKSPAGSPTLDGVGEANARLIAAAPELLEALQEVTTRAENMAKFLREQGYGLYDAHNTEVFTAARAAIAKATGEA